MKYLFHGKEVFNGCTADRDFLKNLNRDFYEMYFSEAAYTLPKQITPIEDFFDWLNQYDVIEREENE
ncbi:hypothetical protein ACKP2L_05435 [Oenococcus alcoholitolerans]|uniref:hypothetical protein n=1 Tax=Oenococcus alcoholitolerans TaxID=931074 RepID=UPI003F70412A